MPNLTDALAGLEMVKMAGTAVESMRIVSAASAIKAQMLEMLPQDAFCSNCEWGRQRKGRSVSCLLWRRLDNRCPFWQRSEKSWRDLGLLCRVVEYRQNHAYPPSLEDLRKLAGWASKSAVFHALQRLEAAGHVSHKPRLGRTLRVLALPADWPEDWPVP